MKNRIFAIIWAFAAVFTHVSDAYPAVLPDFIPTVRAYWGAGLDNIQHNSLKELGLAYVQKEAPFIWDFIDRGDNRWKWLETDRQMNELAASGLKVIPFIMCPKSAGLPWDKTITRKDPRFKTRYGEFAYEVVKRYHKHPAWSGLIAVWGGSADVWDQNYSITDPEVVIPLLNAAYDGIKRADPQTIVIGFNFATTAHSLRQWEEYHRRAFAMSPKFDWYGVQSHGVPATFLEAPGAYTGVVGLLNVRKFLDQNGYAAKPLWMNEAGFQCGEDLGGFSEQLHAEQVVESYIMGRSLGVNLKGWVYFAYFFKSHPFEDGADYGLMTSLDQNNPPKPRLSWLALQTLIKKVDFFGYTPDGKLSGEYNMTTPFVLKFRRPGSRLWVIFSPWGFPKSPPKKQEVKIPIAPALRARLITMTGEEKTVTPDNSGNITITSTSSPVYLAVQDQ